MNEMEELTRLREQVQDRIARLRTIVKKLPVYDPAQEPPNGNSAPVSTATRQKAPQVAIYNYGPVGTLNTGEVLGDIHSHVSAVTGVSAEAFREAIEKFAESVAGNRELADENRQLVLESIDVAAEEATRPPEKRRRKVVGALLLAIPGAISVSGGAIEAWQTFGPAIRAQFGL
jgi:hypothetical protein